MQWIFSVSYECAVVMRYYEDFLFGEMLTKYFSFSWCVPPLLFCLSELRLFNVGEKYQGRNEWSSECVETTNCNGMSGIKCRNWRMYYDMIGRSVNGWSLKNENIQILRWFHDGIWKVGNGGNQMISIASAMVFRFEDLHRISLHLLDCLQERLKLFRGSLDRREDSGYTSSACVFLCLVSLHV